MDLNTPIISKIIDNWIDEDIGRGDLTSPSITEENGNAYWIAKEGGIFCGVEIIKEIFKKIDLKISSKFYISDGDEFIKDQKLLEIYGPSKSLLASERIGLNIAMHLSGISTYTKNLTDKLEGTNIKLADTRKTTPGLRIFEKYAFKCGGGVNHRMGLYDAAMIKENHIAWTDNLKNAVQKIPPSFAIEYALPFSSVIEGLVRSPLPISSSIQLSMILFIIGVFKSTKLKNN